MTLDIAQFKMLLLDKLDIKDKSTEEHFKKRVEAIFKAPPGEQSWSRYRNFWPPTIIKALRARTLIIFFGAGTSAAAELPTWRDMLEQRFGVPTEFLKDENLKNDNLTLGEIASRLIGREQLQSNLRSIYKSDSVRPTAIHYCLAGLGLPVYITTNYDTLFEKAWADIYEGKVIPSIFNAGDLKIHADASHKLYKIHGSADRIDEMLVLTRSDYRQHYRSNAEVFEEIKKAIRVCPTVFTGFSHTDPEIGRLIDDIIFRYEEDIHQKRSSVIAPDIYNLQFENTYVTNERFAAKGMVALNIRLVDELNVDPRTGGIADAVAELVDATACKMDDVTSVDDRLADLVKRLKTELDNALAELKKRLPDFAAALSAAALDATEIKSLLAATDMQIALATQGLYLLNASGHLIDLRLDPRMNQAERLNRIEKIRKNFGERPYFQAAKSFRRPFISNLFYSIFNGNATFAICVPVIAEKTNNFLGLLFSACQVGMGQWRTPIEAVEELRKSEQALGAYILDGQGMVVLPPRGEFKDRDSKQLKNEPRELRTGYEYAELKILSKKDRIINRLAENIVPVEKDDDVLSLDKDLDIYAKIQNIGDLGWRCAVSRTIKFSA